MAIRLRTVGGETHNIPLDPRETIKKLKMRIHDSLGIAPDEQILIYGKIILDNARTVENYEIDHLSLIDFVMKIPLDISIRTIDGTQIQLKMDKFDTVAGMKLKIEEKIGLDRDEQILIYGADLLQEDDKTIANCGITRGSVIDVRPK